jgi:hypothetical protein
MPKFQVRARGYAPRSTPRARASPPKLFTSGSKPLYFVQDVEVLTRHDDARVVRAREQVAGSW